MILKVICLVAAIVCALGALLVKKLSPVVLKRTPTDSEVLNFKIIMLIVVAVCALAIILPDFVNF